MLLNKENRLTQASYYEASVSRPAQQASLQGDINCNVCVVGGGYVGLSAALELAERGYSVTVLEAQTVGWGASGRNGGQALVGFAGDGAVEAQFDLADAKRAWQMTVEGLQLMRDRIEKYAIDCDFTPGYLSVAVNQKKAKELHDWVAHIEQRYGYHMQNIAAHEMPSWIASERFQGAAYDANSGHLHPLKYCLGLAQAARAAGVTIYEKSPVTQIERAAKPLVRTAAGSVRCDFVVLAGNVYLNEYGTAVAPELDAKIMPVGTYIVTTEPLGQVRCDALIAKRAAVCDTNFVLDYFRPTADHRLLFGGRVSYSTVTPPNLKAAMHKNLLRVFPQLGDVRVDYSWGGFVDITMNRAPDFGRLDSNLYYLQGFSGHGLVLSGIAGKLAAEAIAGQAERFDLMQRITHHRFPGGAALRTPALVLGMLYHRLRDLL
jgi:gamma-glutamylputrescine oxidase